MLLIVLPNLVDPVTNSIEDETVCTTKVKAFIFPVTVKDPVIFVLPDTLNTPLFKVATAEAVAAFVDASATNILPMAGLFMVLKPVPEEPEVPLVPEDPEVPLVPVLPEDPVDPLEPLVPDVPVLPLVPEVPVEPDVPEVPADPP